MSNELAELIQSFSQRFSLEIQKKYKATTNTAIITNILPELIQNRLNLDSDLFRVYGSVGKGNWSEIPWVCILDKEVTTSTTEGYYIGILFDRNQENIYLSLSVGWTQFENEYGILEGKQKIREFCKYYANEITTKPHSFFSGTIDLHAQNKLGKGYELGSIISKKIPVNQIRDDVFFADIKKLLEVYTELKLIAGDSLLNIPIDPIEDISIKEFSEKIAQATFEDNTNEAMMRLIEVANQSPPESRLIFKKQIIRNRKFADFVKSRAHYICELCGREPFTQRNGKPYAEADHITQLGSTSRGLDSPDNMRCLCAQCHSVVTHGSSEEINKLIKKI